MIVVKKPFETLDDALVSTLLEILRRQENPPAPAALQRDDVSTLLEILR